MMQIEEQEHSLDFESCRKLIEFELGSYFLGEHPYARLLESMRYSLLAGGKRIRAVLCVKFCEAAEGDPLKALGAACAIEMLHAYSLIHDDLPCMDDDDLRRGMPSNHIAYGESTATLAGDALQAAAFEALLSSDLPPENLVEMGKVLANAAGPHGICGGQLLDIAGEGRELSLAELEGINRLKTAALICASAEIGVLAAGGSLEQRNAAREYALSLGLAFQIRDDVLDYTASQDELGKPVFSDRDKGKSTYASLLDEDECERIILEETAKAISAIDGSFGKTGFLKWLALMLSKRNN